MTLKFNYVKYCLVILGIALLFTGNIDRVSAGWVRPNPANFCQNGTFPNCSDYPKSSRSVGFSSKGTNYDDFNTLNYVVCNSYNANYNGYNDGYGRYYVISKPSNLGGCSYISGNVKTFNDGDFLTWRVRQNDDSQYYGWSYFQFNFINQTYDGSAPVFHWWYDLGKTYNSLNYAYLPDLPDMNNTGDNFYFVQPRHGSWIFYNYLYDVDLKTVQYIGNQVLRDKFIYVDSLTTSDNIWLVDTALNKAWSMSESDINVISDFMFGNFTFSDDLLNNAGWTDSYVISINTGGSSFLPQTYGNFVGSSFSDLRVGSKSFKGFNIGITYQKDYEFVGPDYGSSSGNNSVSSGSYNDQVLSYDKCLVKYKPIGELSNLMYNCYSSYSGNADDGQEFFEMLNYVNTLPYYKENDLEYTGYKPFNIFSSCSRWLDYADMLYQHYTGSDYYDLVDNAVAYGYTNSFDIENFCGSYPTVSSEQSWACQYLGIGCNGFSFGMGYDQIKSFIKPFWDDSVGQLVNSFNSGYNYINVPSCQSDFYGKSYGRANTIFIVLVAFLIFELYQLFKS